MSSNIEICIKKRRQPTPSPPLAWYVLSFLWKFVYLSDFFTLKWVPGGVISHCMMMSSNGNIFRITGHLCGEFTGPRWIPAQRPVTWSFDVFFDLRPNKWLSKQSWGWWFETLRAHYDVIVMGPLLWITEEFLLISEIRCLSSLEHRTSR